MSFPMAVYSFLMNILSHYHITHLPVFQLLPPQNNLPTLSFTHLASSSQISTTLFQGFEALFPLQLKILFFVQHHKNIPIWLNINVVFMTGIYAFDKNHTGLSPHGISVISGFVFMSDQVCSEDYLVTGPMVGTYFSHGFGLYSHIFGFFFNDTATTEIYTHVPILWNTGTAWLCYDILCSNCSKYSTLHDPATRPMIHL